MSAEVNPKLYRTCSVRRSFGGRYKFPYTTSERAFSDSCAPGDAEAACQDPAAIARACGFSAKLNENEACALARSGAGLYVIAADGYGATKIGVSYSPADRLVGLQGSHWAPLRLHAVLWSLNKMGGSIEQEALRKASAKGKRLNGEWVDMTPAEAFALIFCAAKVLRAPICDSAAWLENWNVRMRALAAAKTGATQMLSRIAA